MREHKYLHQRKVVLMIDGSGIRYRIVDVIDVSAGNV